MRKFKIKNRKKRKYTRRKQAQTSFYFSKSIAMGLIPTIFIIVAASATFILIQNSTILRLRPDISPIIHNWQDISFELTLPEINAASLVGQIVDVLTQFVTNVVSATLNLITTILNALLAFQIEAEKIIVSVLITTLNTVTYFVQQATIIIQKGILFTYRAINTVTVVTAELATKLLFVFYKIIITKIIAIKTTVITFFELLIFSLQWLGNKIIEFTNQIIKIIRWPFIKLADDLQVFAPFWQKVADILKNSSFKLITNLNTLLKHLSV